MKKNQPFMILGRPRSGTNFLQDLISANPLCIVQNEPFSMHTSFARREDMSRGFRTQSALKCRCSACYVCHLRAWLMKTPGAGFKETLLFDTLDLLNEWSPDLKIIYIDRNLDSIVNSHINGKLFDKWNLTNTNYWKNYNNTVFDGLPTDHKSKYILHLNTLRDELWLSSRAKFDHITISYENLIADNIGELSKIMRFLGMELSNEQRLAINSRSKDHKYIHTTYGTFNRQ